VYDDLFRDLDSALVTKQEINCFKQKSNGRTRWIIEIDDPHEVSKFEAKLFSVLNRIRGKKDASPERTA
jgi:hypothetical protein